MSALDAWMPIFWGDYLRDTTHLSAAEHGAYLLLIAHYWTTAEPLSDDDEKLRRIARMERAEWKRARPTLEAFFSVADGRWFHRRIEKELAEWQARKDKNKVRARTAASKRWASSKDASSNATSMPGAMLEQCPPPPPINTPQSPPSDDGDWTDRLGPVEKVIVAVWRQSGTPDDRCRQWLTTTKGPGRAQAAAWLAHGLSADEITAKVTAVFDEAEHRGQPIKQPFPYLDTVIRAMAAERQHQQQAAAAGGIDWPGRVRGFKRKGLWLDSWGAEPGRPGCIAPKAVLAEFGYAGRADSAGAGGA